MKGPSSAPGAAATAALLALLAVALAPVPASPQLIPIRSIPVASGDQFRVYPSQRLGMGGVGVALPDTVLDPWINPATGSRVGEALVLATPTFYGISEGRGAGRTLPVAALFAGERWFGGASVALQQIEDGDGEQGIAFATAIDMVWSEPPRQLSSTSGTNTYVHGLLGHRFAGTGWSVAGGASWSGLDAMDGVDMLYAGSQQIEQSGHLADFRLGALHEGEDGKSLEALVIHHRVDMKHDVSYVDWRWQPTEPRDPAVGPGRMVLTERLVPNYDETNLWGAHLGYRFPIAGTSWRAGGILTANRMSHPKIPNYDIQNIPRDPGDSWAWNIGAGLARADGPVRFAVEAVFEPIWSETWADAADTVRAADGRLIQPGEKTVENDFAFGNVHLRMGVERQEERWGVQLGVEASAYDYTLEQVDHVRKSFRDQDESWMEWSPTLGGTVRFPDLELSWVGRRTTGTGRPGVAFDRNVRFPGPGDYTLSSGNFIVAPSGPLTLQDATVVTHQITVRIPLR